MSAAFTPGPWFAGKPIPYDGDPDFSTVSVGPFDVSHKPSPCHYEDTICEVWANPNIAEDAEDNARLVAAAPDLYEALQAFEKQWNTCGRNSDFGRYFKGVRDVAVAALDKARGEQ